MKKTAVIILAAGKGTRMNSERAKVLHEIAGNPMLSYVLDVSRKLGAKKIAVIAGHQADRVREAFHGKGIVFVEQPEQLGTGHAVMQAENALSRFKGHILILSGDAPLITSETLKALTGVHETTGAALTILTAEHEDPSGYGRVIRDGKGIIKRIAEEKDASEGEKSVREVNTGIYCVSPDFLFSALKMIKPQNRQKEYYLTDIVRIAVKGNKKVASFKAADFRETMGINSRIELAEAGRILRLRVTKELMLKGVTIIDPSCTYISPSVRIAPDAVIYPGSTISGETSIGRGTIIGPGCMITDARVGEGAGIKAYSIIDNCEIKDHACVGPMAHIRPNSAIEKGARVGNFVEVKKSTLGEGSKANHLSYIGDATIGEGVNIGAGTITCNYDGVRKHRTIIEDNVFVGSDTQIIAPVKIGKDSLIGAGTTVTKNVPKGSLVLSRVKQVTKKRKGTGGRQ